MLQYSYFQNKFLEYEEMYQNEKKIKNIFKINETSIFNFLHYFETLITIKLQEYLKKNNYEISFVLYDCIYIKNINVSSTILKELENYIYNEIKFEIKLHFD